MCKISNYPGLLARANETLRREGINPEMPGCELLKRAIVVYKVGEWVSKEDLLREVKTGILIPANKDLKRENENLEDGKKQDSCERDEVEQWMLEAIKSIGIEIPLMEYIKQLSNETV